MKYTKTLIFVGIILASAFMYILLPVSNSEVYAVDGSDFKPGRIMDDAIFFNYDSMSVAEIQKFLDSKMPNCNTNHSESSHWKDFGQPYICLKDYREDPTVPIADCTDEEIQNHFGFSSEDSRYEAAKNYCWWKRGRTNLVGATAGSSSKSAARIIWEAAQEHRINPQVLIVTLQKEQSLLTDDYPWVGQYQKAMGYACPDTAACDPQYRGFYNQVHNAAQQLRRYVTYPERYNHAVGDNYVRYHPNSSCGGSQVNIATQATAAFYNYTPYQPNSASLNSYPGTGDSCSSYGNRNFWFKFNEWFGSSVGTPLFRVGSNDAVYILGSNSNYYHIPNRKILKAYGLNSSVGYIKSVDQSFLNGKSFSGKVPLIVRFEGDAVYLVDQGGVFHFTSKEILAEFGYSIGQEAHLPIDSKYYYRNLGDIQQVVRDSNGSGVWYVNNGKKHHIINGEAYFSGSPSYASRDKVSLNYDYIKSLDSGAPIMTANKLLFRADTKSYAFWDGVDRQDISKEVVSLLNIATDYSAGSGIINQLSDSGQPLIKNLVRTSGGLYYIIDKDIKLSLGSSVLSETGLTETDFVNTPGAVFDAVDSKSFNGSFRLGNDNSVYLVSDGKAFLFNSPEALIEYGYNFNQVVSFSSINSKLFPFSGKKILATGTLFRIKGTNPVYFVSSKNSSLHIPSPALLREFGFSFSEVKEFTATERSSYVVAGDAHYFLKDTLDKVWLIQDDGIKKEVSSDLYGAFSINIDDLMTLSANAMNDFENSNPVTDLLRAHGEDRVYKIEEGRKRGITSRSAFIERGYSFNDVSDVSGVFLSSIPSGEDIN